MKKSSKKILDQVNFPQDLKKIPVEKLPELSEEIREFLVETVAKVGGHFGSNLGVVELTVALHKVFDAPRDQIIWDVGHQAYTHKILTGRKNKLYTIRKRNGLAPFPKREESEYDALSVGHTSTSISAAVGMALANRKKKNKPKIIVIIGDGALSGGMAFEALNHAGDSKADVLVVVNDNRMSISPNVGGMSKYLTRLISSPAYIRLRNKGREALSGLPKLKDFLMKTEEYTKGMIVPGTLFEELGFEYFGPIDGHDTVGLVEILENLKKIKGPRILHVITQKGKGYAAAEKDEFCQHAVSPFNPKTGKKNGDSKKDKNFTDVFSEWICDKAREDNNLEAVTPAMCSGSGLLEFSQEFPERFYDVGIAEQHSLTFAVGLALQGKKPVVAIYSSFLQRAYDQLIHDIALQKADVLLAIDRAGIVGPDGATHAGSFDLSFMRVVPNLIILTPSSLNECYAMLEWGYDQVGPVAVRYPRGGGKIEYDKRKAKKIKIELGKSNVVREGRKIAILAFGTLLSNCQKVAKELDATLVDMRFVKPLDKELLQELAKNHKYFITIEDNVVSGGAGSVVNELVLEKGWNIKVKNLGLPDEFLPHGTREEILEEVGLGEKNIFQTIKTFEKESLH